MIFHVHSVYAPRNPDTVRRLNLAKQTWQMQPWKDLPVPESSCRLYHDRLGAVPYIKDVFARAVDGKPSQDIMVFTNSDICVSPTCCFAIAAALQSIDAAYCFRRDFRRLNDPLPPAAIRTGAHYVGSDLYAFRVGWWTRHGQEFPDMLLGREAWDAVMRILIEMTHPGRNPTLYDLIYHERHASSWENPSNRRTTPSQMHNVTLARQWMLTFGFNPRGIGL